MSPNKPVKKTTAKKPAAAKAPAKTKKAAKEKSPEEARGLEKAKEEPRERYWEAVGRRKTAVARVRLYTRGDKGILINDRPLAEYFRYPALQHVAAEAMELMKSSDRFRVTAKVKGGGIHAQAGAVRHGTARVLVLFNPDFRKRLKRAGFLTRDPRMKERKKFGLKGARRAPQWAKR